MKTRNTMVGIYLLAGTGLLGPSAMQGCSHRGPEQRADWMASKLSGKLDLNDAQKAKLEAVKQQALEVRKAQQSDRVKSVNDIKQLVLSDRLDQAKLKAVLSERHRVMDQGVDAVFARLSDFHASLTPEQKKDAVELIDKLAEKWGGG